MGYRLHSEVEIMLSDGSPRTKGLGLAANITLRSMAHRAHDIGTKRTPRATYFDGWEELARQLGYPDNGPTAERGTMRALAELTERGLIRQVGRQGHGRGKRHYELLLLLPPLPDTDVRTDERSNVTLLSGWRPYEPPPVT